MGLFSFGTKKRGVIMITDAAFRFVYAHTMSNGTVRVTHAIEQRIPSGVVLDGVIEQRALFVEQLRSFRRKLPTRRVHLLLPEETIVVVPLDRPHEGIRDAQLEHVVREFLEQKLAETIAPTDGFEVLSIIDDGSRLFADIASTSLVTTYKDVCADAGLKVISVDTPHPDWATHTEYAGSSHVMVGFGEYSTAVVLLNGGVPVIKSSIPVGREHLIATIKDLLGIQTYEAERIMARYGVTKEHREDYVLEALQQVLLPLEHEVNALIDAWKGKSYKTARERFPLISVLLHGEAMGIPGLHDHVAHATRTNTEYIDIAKTINAPLLFETMSRDEMVRFAPALWKVHELL